MVVTFDTVRLDVPELKVKLEEVARVFPAPPNGTELARMSKERLNVPEVVMGEPVTLRPMGVDRATEVTVPLPVPAQVPLMAKQPEFKLIPPTKVDVAVEVEKKYGAEIMLPAEMPKKVEVAEEVATK